MNKNQKGKLAVIALGIIGVVLAVGLLALGIVFLATCFGDKLNVVKLVLGILFIIISLIFGAVSIAVTWVGGVLKATKGSLKDEPLPDKTINANLCQKCGVELKNGDRYCSKCGQDNLEEKLCPHCNAPIANDSKFCTVCGKEIE